MKKILISAIILLVLVSPSFAKVSIDGGYYIVDDAEGYAPVVKGKKGAAREEAKRMAYRDALEKAIGACVTGITEMENFAVTRDKVFSKTSGIVKDFKITNEKVDADGVLTITGVCRVSEKALDGALGPEVIAMLGNPRIMILVDEVIEDKVPFMSATESEALRVFEKAGYLLVDSEQAKMLLHLDAKQAFDDPQKLAEAARTLKADIVVVGRAFARHYAAQKIHGILLYGVEGNVQLKAVLTKTAYMISSTRISQKTGKKPAQTIEEGAERCFIQATGQAAGQIVYKIAYNLASAGSALGGVTVNIKISNASFNDVEAIEEKIREFIGKSGELFERNYADNELEIDVVSDKTARNLASFIAGQDINVDALTAQTITASVLSKKDNAPDIEITPAKLPVASIRIQVSNVNSFEEEKIIEEALNKFVGADGKIFGEYDGGAKVLAITVSYYENPKTSRAIAGFLNRPDVKSLSEEFEELKQHKVTALKVTGMTQDSVTVKIEKGVW